MIKRRIKKPFSMHVIDVPYADNETPKPRILFAVSKISTLILLFPKGIKSTSFLEAFFRISFAQKRKITELFKNRR